VDVIEAVRAAATAKSFDPSITEIAFFGGSFTAVNRNYMLELLRTAAGFVEQGGVSGIRISTRPDAIDREILDILKQYHVTSIELGAQSMSNRVLKKNNRGHTAQDIIDASALIKEYGFSLGLQMMTGLYGDSDQRAVKTAKEIIELRPDTVRIYPTVVLKGTDLAALYADNIYSPQSLEDAVSLASRLLSMFENAGIKVIRLGLHSVEGEGFIAGPWHPAFSELCSSKLYLDKALSILKIPGKYTLYVPKGATSKMSGQKRSNIIALKENGFECTVKETQELKDYEIIAERNV
jgi:histone acetyltransferase (RNA polymerase elongator complex component)